MRAPTLRLTLDDEEMIIDSFAGGGGASTGIKMATGREPDIAVNHNPKALAVYKANHPNTRVLCEDVHDVEPRFVVGRRPVGLMWLSPDCTYFARARGGKPHRDRNRARRRRGLAGVALKWAEQVRPRVVCMENVPEFKKWGPLMQREDGKWVPDPDRAGQSYSRWIRRWENLGYAHDAWELNAADFGAPTKRKRYFMVFRCDGLPIVKPLSTHAPAAKAQGLGLTPYRTAAECVDYSLPCPSIFLSKVEAKAAGFPRIQRPLSDASLCRVATGVVRFVLEAKRPFIIPVKSWGGGGNGPGSIDEPLRTVTTGKRGEFAVVSPLLARIGQYGGNGSYVNDARDPLTAVTTKAEHMLVVPTLIQTSWGERPGQAPRVPGLHKPLGTIMAEGGKHALVAAFLAKSYGGPAAIAKQPPGRPLDVPVDTVTAKDHSVLVTSHIMKLKGTCKDGQPLDEPLATVQAQGLHYAEVRSFLVKFAGLQIDGPFVTVEIDGEVYVIVDIGLRMLEPRELYNAQSFPPDYVIDPVYNGKRLSKTDQTFCCGNAVPPVMSEALVLAQFTPRRQAEVA